MALVTTPAAPTSDSYVSVADATAYFLAREDAESWNDLTTDPDRERALKNATRDLDRLFSQVSSGVSLIDQSLEWPWNDVQIPCTADSGSTTTAVCDVFALTSYPDDYFNGGAIWVYDSGNVAPEFEAPKLISDFVRLTGTFTFAAFTAAIANGNSLEIFPPPPRWLKNATCEQALFLLSDERTLTGADRQAGIKERSTQDGTITYLPIADAPWLCEAAYQGVSPYLPESMGISRG